MKHAYVFPGQGAQAVGMGKDLYDNVPAARELFEKANEILGFRITDIMFAGTDDELRQTRVTQPAVFLHSVIMAKALGVEPDCRGRSLARRVLGPGRGRGPLVRRRSETRFETSHGHAGRLRGAARHDGRHPRPGRRRRSRRLCASKSTAWSSPPTTTARDSSSFRAPWRPSMRPAKRPRPQARAAPCACPWAGRSTRR